MAKVGLITLVLFPILFACGTFGFGEGSLAERVEGVQEELARIDRDQDGKASLAEVIAAITASIGVVVGGVAARKKLAKPKATVPDGGPQ